MESQSSTVYCQFLAMNWSGIYKNRTNKIIDWRALLDSNKLHFNWSLVLYFISTPDWITFRHVNDTKPTRNETLIATVVSWCQTSSRPFHSINLTCVSTKVIWVYSIMDSVFRRRRRPHLEETWLTMTPAWAIMTITSPESAMPTSILTKWWWVECWLGQEIIL